jgi:hypothetical protein
MFEIYYLSIFIHVYVSPIMEFGKIDAFPNSQSVSTHRGVSITHSADLGEAMGACGDLRVPKASFLLQALGQGRGRVPAST